MVVNGQLTNITLNVSVLRENDFYGTVQTFVFGAWLVVIIVCSILGNALVMAAILFVKELRRLETNLFLFNLALSDIMVGIFMAPVSLVTLVTEQWHLGDTLCTLNLMLNTTFLFTSVHTLMYISIHKYVTAKRLAACNTEPVKRWVCKAMIGASWLWGILFGLIASVWLGKAEYKMKTTQCGPEYPVFTVQSVSLSVTNFVINFLIPFVIMVVMYSKIYFIMRATTRFRRQSTRRESELEVQSAQEAAVNTMKIVLGCFFICWLPYLIYTNYVFFKDNRDSIPAFFNPLVSTLS